MEISILHLYPELMNLYGEYGNINILKSRLEEQGFKVNIIEKSLNDEIDFYEPDFVYCGAGTERNKMIALEHLKKYQIGFSNFVQSGKPCLFTGNSLELLGKSIKRNDREDSALGIFGFEVKELEERITEDIILKSSLFKREVVGFINKQSKTINNDDSLFDIIYESSPSESNGREGYIKNNLIATYTIGPLLVKNPDVLDFFVRKIIECKFNDFEIKNIEHENEEKGYTLTYNELNQRNQKSI